MLTDEALKQFTFIKNKLKDKNHFSKKIIERKYRQLAKTCHPDRPGGSEEAFRELGVYYGVLMAMVSHDNGVQNDKVIDMVLAISLDQATIP